MRIEKQYIRKLSANLPNRYSGHTTVPAVRVAEIDEERLSTVGFPEDPEPGDQVLPPASLGRFAEYNAEGKEIIHRDQPKETVSYPVEWTWEEWHGDERVERTEIRYRSIDRYPRSEVPPPGVELAVRESEDGDVYVVAGEYPYEGGEDDELQHAINLLLESFGHCEILREDLTEFEPVETRRLNWEILPPGEHPWEEVGPRVSERLGRLTNNEESVFRYTFGTVTGHDPEFCAIGRGGFSDYVVFGFPEKGLYVFESPKWGNATYVFQDDWSELSKLSKAEILAADLHHARLIHEEGWEDEINELLA